MVIIGNLEEMILSEQDPKQIPTLSRKKAARFLQGLGVQIEASTLAKLAANKNAGKGPSFWRDGWKSVRYSQADLEAWASKRLKRIE